MIKIIFLTVSDFPISNFRMELDCGLEYYSILEQKKIFVEGFFGKVVLKIQWDDWSVVDSCVEFLECGVEVRFVGRVDRLQRQLGSDDRESDAEQKIGDLDNGMRYWIW